MLGRLTDAPVGGAGLRAAPDGSGLLAGGAAAAATEALTAVHPW